MTERLSTAGTDSTAVPDNLDHSSIAALDDLAERRVFHEMAMELFAHAQPAQQPRPRAVLIVAAPGAYTSEVISQEMKRFDPDAFGDALPGEDTPLSSSADARLLHGKPVVLELENLRRLHPDSAVSDPTKNDQDLARYVFLAVRKAAREHIPIILEPGLFNPDDFKEVLKYLDRHCSSVDVRVVVAHPLEVQLGGVELYLDRARALAQELPSNASLSGKPVFLPRHQALNFDDPTSLAATIQRLQALERLGPSLRMTWVDPSGQELPTSPVPPLGRKSGVLADLQATPKSGEPMSGQALWRTDSIPGQFGAAVGKLTQGLTQLFVENVQAGTLEGTLNALRKRELGSAQLQQLRADLARVNTGIAAVHVELLQYQYQVRSQANPGPQGAALDFSLPSPLPRDMRPDSSVRTTIGKIGEGISRAEALLSNRQRAPAPGGEVLPVAASATDTPVTEAERLAYQQYELMGLPRLVIVVGNPEVQATAVAISHLVDGRLQSYELAIADYVLESPPAAATSAAIFSTRDLLRGTTKNNPEIAAYAHAVLRVDWDGVDQIPDVVRLFPNHVFELEVLPVALPHPAVEAASLCNVWLQSQLAQLGPPELGQPQSLADSEADIVLGAEASVRPLPADFLVGESIPAPPVGMRLLPEASPSQVLSFLRAWAAEGAEPGILQPKTAPVWSPEETQQSLQGLVDQALELGAVQIGVRDGEGHEIYSTSYDPALQSKDARFLDYGYPGRNPAHVVQQLITGQEAALTSAQKASLCLQWMECSRIANPREVLGNDPLNVPVAEALENAIPPAMRRFIDQEELAAHARVGRDPPAREKLDAVLGPEVAEKASLEVAQRLCARELGTKALGREGARSGAPVQAHRPSLFPPDLKRGSEVGDDKADGKGGANEPPNSARPLTMIGESGAKTVVGILTAVTSHFALVMRAGHPACVKLDDLARHGRVLPELGGRLAPIALTTEKAPSPPQR